MVTGAPGKADPWGIVDMPQTRREPLGKVRTKIVATVGPASRAPATLRALIEAGVDVFRLNFSHGEHEEHAAALTDIRNAADACGVIVAVLQDLCGPKIRLGPIAGDAVECPLDSIFTLHSELPDGYEDPHALTCTYPTLAADLTPGDRVFFADGTVAMTVLECDSATARLQVTLPGRIRSHQGINLPGAVLSVPCLTPKDLADLDWTAAHPIEYVGLSFVRQASDVTRLRAELDQRGLHATRIVAKIEKPQAVANLDAVIAVSDAVMVARGDLGVEIDVAKVPGVQKRVIDACRRAGVPVITATQMLNSMETSTRPTRAEATDVFNAVLDGTDAVMLSGETAIGLYPIEAVDTMSRICAEAEALPRSYAHAVPDASSLPAPAAGTAGYVLPITSGVVEAVASLTRRLGATLVVVATHSGRTALALSKQRYGPPTLALTPDPAVARALALNWGVTPLLSPSLADAPTIRLFALDWARTHGLIHSGDCVVLVLGTMPRDPAHNEILVDVVE
jgi:pyruvate kinase